MVIVVLSSKSIFYRQLIGGVHVKVELVDEHLDDVGAAGENSGQKWRL